ncbi:MAG: hypothetical protein KUG78_00625 [Kangiellaceae bacterium]|nr:hypothetical protein [Kangiellaceae bacterium]
MKAHILAIMLYLGSNYSLASDYLMEALTIDDYQLTVTHWLDKTESTSQKSNRTIVLLSGPTDYWNSDSAWYARLAPKLAKIYPTISIDRHGQLLSEKRALELDKTKLGYIEFGKALSKLVAQLKLKNITFISFASANISLLQYFDKLRNVGDHKVILVDPDVLTPYSINRYSNDALPFKNNLSRYVEYISQGKYDKRANQKNGYELADLKKMSQMDPDTNWKYIDEIMNKRLERHNLISQFHEISLYAEDLRNAKVLLFPRNLPISIIDTDFEIGYIEKENDSDKKQELARWRSDAEKYYKNIVSESKKRRYYHLEEQEHLVPFSNPNFIIELVRSDDNAEVSSVR